jgi:ubiquinone biosynthesis UbiH/UbiF/VisC/COQ6 family hydroxylase
MQDMSATKTTTAAAAPSFATSEPSDQAVSTSPLIVDVAIVGAGPVGLCLAHGLSRAGLTVALVEKQPRQSLAEAAYDGREIALTQASCAILRELGLWSQFQAADCSPLRDALVLNGSGAGGAQTGASMTIRARSRQREELGFLVPNFQIRRAAYRAVFEGPQADRVQLFERSGVAVLQRDSASARLQLDGAHAGQQIHAALVVAADSRFSETRRLMGLGARMRDFGRTMMVCRMTHEQPHHHVAWEWFAYGQTLALLPLNARIDPSSGEALHRSSVVLTLPGEQMQALQQLDDQAFGQEMTRRFENRLGAMAIDRDDSQGQGERHVYPLVGVYADDFCGLRSALVGDAAVGMHPVTAHGFNLGLQGQRTLLNALLQARQQGLDLAAPQVLSAYNRAHKLASWHMYQGTNFVATLYTQDQTPARWLREAVLRLADKVAPIKQLIASHLVQEPDRGPGLRG